MVGSAAWDTQQVVSLAQVGSAIDVRPVFAQTRAALLSLLPELSSQEWTAPAVCPGWAVKDIAVHLLHDDLRRLSRTRDGYSGGPAPATGQLRTGGGETDQRCDRSGLPLPQDLGSARRRHPERLVLGSALRFFARHLS